MNQALASRASRTTIILVVAASVAILLIGVCVVILGHSSRDPELGSSVSPVHPTSMAEEASETDAIDREVKQRLQRIESQCDRMERELSELKSQMESATGRVAVADPADPKVIEREVYAVLRQMDSASLQNEISTLASKLAVAYGVSSEDRRLLSDALSNACRALDSSSLSDWWLAQTTNEKGPKVDELNMAVDAIKSSTVADLKGIVKAETAESFVNQLIELLRRHRSQHGRWGAVADR